MTISLFDVLFHSQTSHVYCFIYIGSKSSNFMVDAGSYAPSVLLPNAWFSLVPDFCWAVGGKKSSSVGVSTGRHAGKLETVIDH